MGFEHIISNSEWVQDSNANNSNLDELIQKMISDWKLDSNDTETISTLYEALGNDTENVYERSKCVLQDILQDSLIQWFMVHDIDWMLQLQKIIDLAGLDFNIQDIYEINREYLQTKVIIKDGSWFFEYDEKIIEPEEREIIFELSNWDLNVFVKNISLRNNDFLGTISSWNTNIQKPEWYDIAKYTSIDDMTGSEMERINTIDSESSVVRDAVYKDMQQHRVNLLIEDNNALTEKIRLIEWDIQNISSQIQSFNNQVATLSESIKLLWEIDTLTNAKIDTLLLDIWTVRLQLNTEISKINTAIAGLQSIDGMTLIKINELKATIDAKILLCETQEQQLQNLAIMTVWPTQPIAPSGEISAYIGWNQNEYLNRTAPIFPIIRNNSEDWVTSKFTEPEEITTTTLPPISYLDPNRPVDKDVPDLGIPFEHPDYGTPDPENVPVEIEVLQEETPELSIHNEISFSRLTESEINLLPPIESRADLLRALESIRWQKFPLVRPDSLIYAYIFQVAISMLDVRNTMGTIDALWGNKSGNALKIIQAEYLNFDGSTQQQIDWNPWKDTIEWLITYLS